ncbi:unnamed protein product [Lactuca saligna]|uniref:Uncharacterized protein n=1 Tax=Lactuca saligna TaxID=75948 RepID=A0AA35YUL6_LACSI|nr:unnamed protein product [Lactuca saligna]
MEGMASIALLLDGSISGHFVQLPESVYYQMGQSRLFVSTSYLSVKQPTTSYKNHKGRILEPVEKLKGGLRSRSPRPRYRDEYKGYRRISRSSSRDRSPPRRSRSPSRSRSPEGGGNEKASTSSPYSHGRANSRSPLQRSDSNGFPGPMGLMSTSHLEQEAAVLALSTLMTIAPAEVYAEFEKVAATKNVSAFLASVGK